jgi:surface antigen
MLKTSWLIFIFLGLTIVKSDKPDVGTVIDELDGVVVHYNGNVDNVFGRHISDDGYNYGLRYQCVEFVKRYYDIIYDHQMPESYGNAMDFFDKSLGDEGFNETRGLFQFRNIRSFVPQKGDIVIFDGTEENSYGHMGIVAKVENNCVEIVQQNWGLKSRHEIKLVEYEGIYTLADFDILGWLRK